jgi:predicted ATPase with chaperone activity
VIVWEYLIVALPAFEAPTRAPGVSASVEALNGEGTQGWEAVGMTVLANDTVAVLMKRPKQD